MITLAEITPVALCIVTQDLLDTKRFRFSFCDNLLLRIKDEHLEPKISGMKKDISMSSLQKKFLEGHKAVIINNLDRIMGFVLSRYRNVDLRLVEGVIAEAKDLMEKVMSAESFEELSKLEPTFKAKITLPVYELFIQSLKKD